MLKRTPSPPSFLQTIWWWILVATTSRGLAQAPQGGLTTTNTLTGSAPDTLSRKGKKWFLEYWRLWWVPNQQRTLHKLPTELLCRSFVTSKQPTGLVKSVPHVQKHVLGNVCVCVFSDWASISHATVGGWAGGVQIGDLSRSFDRTNSV